MNTTRKSLAVATVAATALAGLSLSLAPAATASATATKNFTKTFPQTCAVGILGNRNLTATVTGTVPVSVVHGAAFKLTNAKIKVLVDSATNSAAYGFGARSQQTTLSVVNLTNVNITPKTIDALKTDVAANKIAVPNGGTSSFTVPPTGGITVALRAGTAGQGILRAGSVKGKVQLFDASNNPLGGPQDVSCNGTGAKLTTINFS